MLTELQKIFPEKQLTPWTDEALNDIGFNPSFEKRISSDVSTNFDKRIYPSIKIPNTYWLIKIVEAGAMPWSDVNITLFSTQDKVTMHITRNMIGNNKSETLRVNDGSPYRIEKLGNDYSLKNEQGAVVAVWQRGAIYDKFPLDEEALAVGDPDKPHIYSRIVAQGETIAEAVIPMASSTLARFIHQPPVSILKDVPNSLTKSQKEYLLLFLLYFLTKL